jgi:hypothetical protein
LWEGRRGRRVIVGRKEGDESEGGREREVARERELREGGTVRPSGNRK